MMRIVDDFFDDALNGFFNDLLDNFFNCSFADRFGNRRPSTLQGARHQPAEKPATERAGDHPPNKT